MCGNCFGCDGEAVEGMNVSNDCVLIDLRSDVLLRFTLLLLLVLYAFTFVVFNCLRFRFDPVPTELSFLM